MFARARPAGLCSDGGVRVTGPPRVPVPIDFATTLPAILKPGDDVDRWRADEGASILGYVYGVKPGGIETVNCHARDQKCRDAYIKQVLDPMAEGRQEGEYRGGHGLDALRGRA